MAQDIEYSSFNKVTRITEGNNEVRFTYGSEYARKIMERYENSILVSTKIYVGLYEKEVSGTDVKEVHYLNAGDGLFAIYTRINQSGGSLAYVLKDHLGSIQCLTDESGALTEELSFDAWGRRRDPNTWQPLPMGGSYQTSLGFTSHEHIDIAALVNMEGRLYDPVVGRFLSADPFMQAPDYTQGLNRYSYCLNNPLSLIDPSGYSWLSRNWKSLAAGLVAITVTVVTVGTGATLGQAILSGALGGFSGGFTGALLNGGNIVDAFKAGVIGGVIGGLAGGGANLIGNAAQGLGSFQKELARSLAHGSLGGLTSLAQGGKFKHGFFSGMFASMAGSGMEASGWGVFSTDVGSVVTAAVVGGTASELGGGKFANGAVTGAYTMLFNHMAHRPEDPPTAENEGETWYYGVQRDKVGDVGHSMVRTPDGIIYEINHPDYGQTDGLNSWLEGGPKAVGYRYDMGKDADFSAFWNFGDGRKMVTWQAVNVPNPQASRAFFESWVGGSWDYNFFTSNCKHYIYQGLSTGGASINFRTNIPTEWSGAYVTPWYNPYQ